MGYRLAWYRSNPQSPNACGPPFRTLKEAQRAAPEFNKGRIARGQQPCHCILEYETRPNDRGTVGQRKRKPRAVVLRMDGTVLEVVGVKLATDPFRVRA